MKDRGQEAFDVVTTADLIESFPAAPNRKSRRLLDGLAFPFPKPIEVEALLGFRRCEWTDRPDAMLTCPAFLYRT